MSVFSVSIISFAKSGDFSNNEYDSSSYAKMIQNVLLQEDMLSRNFVACILVLGLIGSGFYEDLQINAKHTTFSGHRYSLSSGVQRGVRRPRSSTFGASKERVFVKNVGK